MRNIPFTKFTRARVACSLERFRNEIRGVAALEFAIIAPVLILMLVGTLEISLAIAVNRKVSRISSTVADLITQSQSLTNSDLDNIMDVSSRIMYPYPNAVEIVITTINVAGSNATVDCSYSLGAPENAQGAPYTVPSSIKEDGVNLVSAKISADHTPMVGWLHYDHGYISFDQTVMTMEEELFLRPRIGAMVNFDEKCP